MTLAEEMERLDRDMQQEFISLSKGPLTIEEMNKLVKEKYRERYLDLLRRRGGEKQ